MMTMAIAALEVRLGSTRVGMLTHLGHEAIAFTFDEGYVDAEQRPTLSLGFKAADGGLVELDRTTRVRLHPFFSNLLPEGHLRQYLAARGGVHPEREFFLLRVLGADLPGGVEVRSLDEVVVPVEDRADVRVAAPSTPLRFSLAGVQLKFSALVEPSKGVTLPVQGVGGDWIVKLPSSRFSSVPENEFAMMTFAQAIGIDVPEVRLVSTTEIGGLPEELPTETGRSLLVRRFDRPGDGRRVHMEDFAQVFGVYPEKKYHRASYGSIARVLWREVGADAIAEFVRRLVFNALLGNADAHLKNWSLLYPDGQTPRLAPAYDLVSTVAYLPDDQLALSLGGTKVFAEIDLERFRRFAIRENLPQRLVLQTARRTAEAIRDQWPSHGSAAALPVALRDAIQRQMRTVPL